MRQIDRKRVPQLGLRAAGTGGTSALISGSFQKQILNRNLATYWDKAENTQYAIFFTCVSFWME